MFCWNSWFCAGWSGNIGENGHEEDEGFAWSGSWWFGRNGFFFFMYRRISNRNECPHFALMRERWQWISYLRNLVPRPFKYSTNSMIYAIPSTFFFPRDFYKIMSKWLHTHTYYKQTYIYMYKYTYIYIYKYIHIYVYICTNIVRIYICQYIYTSVCTYICIYIYMCVFICIYIDIHM